MGASLRLGPAGGRECARPGTSGRTKRFDRAGPSAGAAAARPRGGRRAGAGLQPALRLGYGAAARADQPAGAAAVAAAAGGARPGDAGTGARAELLVSKANQRGGRDCPPRHQGTRMTAHGTAILGGGALGLTLAYRLAAAGERVEVIEREREAGGLPPRFPLHPDGPPPQKVYHPLFCTPTAPGGPVQELWPGR